MPGHRHPHFAQRRELDARECAVGWQRQVENRQCERGRIGREYVSKVTAGDLIPQVALVGHQKKAKQPARDEVQRFTKTLRVVLEIG